MTDIASSPTALITGAARGIGRAPTLALAAEGADILALDIAVPCPGHPQPTAMPEDLTETVRLVESLGRRCLAVQADVRDTGAVEAAVARAVDEFGRLHILIANAGVAIHAALETMSDQQWHLVLDVNLLGVVRMLRANIPALRASGSGRVVVVSSVGGPRRNPRRRPLRRVEMGTHRPSTATAGSGVRSPGVCSG